MFITNFSYVKRKLEKSLQVGSPIDSFRLEATTILEPSI